MKPGFVDGKGLLADIYHAACQGDYAELSVALSVAMRPLGIKRKGAQKSFTEEDQELIKAFWRAVLKQKSYVCPPNELKERAVRLYTIIVAAECDNTLEELRTMAMEACLPIVEHCEAFLEPVAESVALPKQKAALLLPVPAKPIAKTYVFPQPTKTPQFNFDTKAIARGIASGAVVDFCDRSSRK